MPETIQTFETRVSGRWNSRHEFRGDEGPLGVLTIQRNRTATVAGGTFRPEKGEIYTFRRDPGLLRSQFSHLPG